MVMVDSRPNKNDVSNPVKLKKNTHANTVPRILFISYMVTHISMGLITVKTAMTPLRNNQSVKKSPTILVRSEARVELEFQLW